MYPYRSQLRVMAAKVMVFEISMKYLVVNFVSVKVELEIKVSFDMFCNLKKSLMINALSIFFFNLIN